jgi:hypothetical protein
VKSQCPISIFCHLTIFFEFIVQDIEEDMYDGQVLQKLIEKLTSETLNVPEVTQSEDGQRNKLR